MKKFSLVLIVIILIIKSGLSQTPPNSLIPFKNIPEEYKEEVNTLLTEMCEGVGLYTLLGDFKPMSTVDIKSLSVYNQTANVFDKDGNLVTMDVSIVPQTKEEAERYQKMALEKIKYYSTLFELMSSDLFYFQFMPLHTTEYSKSISNPEDSFERAANNPCALGAG